MGGGINTENRTVKASLESMLTTLKFEDDKREVLEKHSKFIKASLKHMTGFFALGDIPEYILDDMYEMLKGRELPSDYSQFLTERRHDLMDLSVSYAGFITGTLEANLNYEALPVSEESLIDNLDVNKEMQKATDHYTRVHFVKAFYDRLLFNEYGVEKDLPMPLRSIPDRKDYN